MEKNMPTINFMHFLIELMGTWVFVFIVGSSRLSVEAFELDFMETAIVTGLIFSIMAALAQKSSGGHYNPAVTISLVMCDKMSIWKGLSYVLAQLIGSFLGASLIAFTASEQLLDKARVNSVFGIPRIRRDYDHGQVSSFIAETLGSAFIMAMNWVASRDITISEQVKGYMTGVAVTVSTMVFYNVSGACFNPVLVIGPSLVSRTIRDFHWIYWFGPLIGMLSTALFLNYMEEVKVESQRRKKKTQEGDEDNEAAIEEQKEGEI